MLRRIQSTALQLQSLCAVVALVLAHCLAHCRYSLDLWYKLLLLGHHLLTKAEALRFLRLVTRLDTIGVLAAVLVMSFGVFIAMLCRLAMRTMARLLHLKLELLLLLGRTLSSLRTLLLALDACAFRLLKVHVVFLEELRAVVLINLML